MKLSLESKAIFDRISPETKLGDLRKIAKEIKIDHQMAMELWETGSFLARQLSILIMDKKLLTQEIIDKLAKDMLSHEFKERNHLIDWLMANQLSRDKKLVALMEAWEHSSFVLQRRIYWYYQARLRWTGNKEHTNTEELLETIEKKLLKEEPEVQWAMNFTAGQIGKWQEEYRERCISIGEVSGLYKEEKAVKGCTPNYLPEFIRIEAAKVK